MNIAEKFKSHYESDCFKDNYAHLLLEDTHNCEYRIQEIARNNWEFAEKYGKNLFLTDEQTEEIYQSFHNLRPLRGKISYDGIPFHELSFDISFI